MINSGDLQQPVRAAKVPLPVVSNVAVMGSYACVTGDGLQVFDLGDPYHSVCVGRHQLDSATTRLQVVGNLVYVATAESGLAIYRVTPQLKLNPQRYSSGLHLSWLGGPGIQLQQATNLSEPVWQDAPNSAGASSVTLSLTNSAAFFRQVKP